MGALCSHAVAVAADGSVIILHFPSDQELGLYIILLHLRKYPKSAENETNNDRMGRDVFKKGEYIKGVCQVYSDGKCVQKWKLW